MTRLFSLLFFLAAIFIACENDENHTPYSPNTGGKTGHNPPADHTVNKHGCLHKEELKDAATNCIECHGDDLRGGTVGVSCYECHGEKWH